ncbi:hypothetical protein JUM41_11070 [Rhizobium pusense]|uniref:hypothetical protein n=1 Tax=Agrobacterium pusense TaxID=648995 RepID=UPI001FCC7DE4|nr:hypothetical protein [Agrobacterium pusense]MCJ2874776.1 hypothetical protein [Agrobacterium pusense]
MPQTTDLPPLPKSSPGKNKFSYKPQWGVILVCESESDQAKLYDALSAIRTCKIKVVVT